MHRLPRIVKQQPFYRSLRDRVILPLIYWPHQRARARGQKVGLDAQQRILSSIDNPMIFDVGANRGVMTREYAQRFPSATIYAFEPTPYLNTELAAQFKQAPHVHVVSQAIGDSCTVVKFHDSPQNPDMNSVLPPTKHNWMASTALIDVEQITLDAFCESHEIYHINLLKMDIQGGELLALRGATTLLSSHRIDCIYMECIVEPLYDRQASFGDLMGTLYSHGYRLFNIFDPYQTGTGQLRWFDVLLLSPRLYAPN